MNLINPRVFFEISIGSKAVGRLTFELFNDLLPITSENFRCLCTGETGLGYYLKPRSYQFSPFHRIIPGEFCQGGDYHMHTGKGGESIYGQYFRNERFAYGHSKRGLLSMAHARRLHTNTSQFFITFDAMPWADQEHVVFGHLIEGFPVLDLIEKQGSSGGRPHKRVEVYECGELDSLIFEHALPEVGTPEIQRPLRLPESPMDDPMPDVVGKRFKLF